MVRYLLILAVAITTSFMLVLIKEDSRMNLVVILRYRPNTSNLIIKTIWEDSTKFHLPEKLPSETSFFVCLLPNTFEIFKGLY